MTERTPIQISENFVLCSDNTIWKWYGYDIYTGKSGGWEKLPPIPTDEEYEKLQERKVEQITKTAEMWRKASERPD